jgi:hypothetical protein
MAQCDDCGFYRTRSYGTGQGVKVVGECRYADPIPQGTIGFWPQVKPDDWCGKWEAIAAAKEPEVRMLGEIPL